ncbi:OLC1v1016950C2 [Oldenlandia corymbosa var. corymbosa]|nr:OLC1v1016950C2 [Oldenlandia corymbosa var. corymbosa]
MGLLVWLLGLCSKLLAVVLCLLVILIIVTLDAAADASTSKTENPDRKKKKLDGKGSSKKGGAAKGTRKKNRVEFMDDAVVVRKSNDVNVLAEKFVEDVELCQGMSEKDGEEDDCKLMEDVGDVVVVRSVNNPLDDDSEKPSDAFDSFGEIAIKDGYVDQCLEEGLEKIQVPIYDLGEVNVTKDVERTDGSKDIGTPAAEAEVAAENSEVVVDCNVKVRDAVTSCLEGFPVEQGMNIDMLGSEDSLESMNDNDRAAGKRVVSNAESLEKEVQVKYLDDKNRVELTREDVAIDDMDAGMTRRVANGPELLDAELGMHTVLDEDKVLLTNDDIVTDERVRVVGKIIADNGESLEGELDGEAIEGQKGITINNVVATAESDAAAGGIAAGKSEFSEEELERDPVEEKSDKFSGQEEDKYPLRTSELENLVVEEVRKYEAACNWTNAESVRKYDNGDHEDSDDDDWEGVERSEMEKVFAEAVNYVEKEWKLNNNWSANPRGNIPKRLYGLHKVAIEGPCNVPPPMALKVTARAKWNAWQSLGNMSPEVAMEEYIKILSDADPGWMLDLNAEGDVRNYLEAGVEGSLDNRPTSSKDSQTNFEFS